MVSKSSRKYVVLAWTKLVEGYPEYTGCLIDDQFKLVETIPRLFAANGEYSTAVQALVKKYQLHLHLLGENKDLFLLTGENLTVVTALQQYQAELIQAAQIADFLTAQMTDTILNLLQK